jgi:hypothetical protein
MQNLEKRGNIKIYGSIYELTEADKSDSILSKLQGIPKTENLQSQKNRNGTEKLIEDSVGNGCSRSDDMEEKIRLV